MRLPSEPPYADPGVPLGGVPPRPGPSLPPPVGPPAVRPALVVGVVLVTFAVLLAALVLLNGDDLDDTAAPTTTAPPTTAAPEPTAPPTTAPGATTTPPTTAPDPAAPPTTAPPTTAPDPSSPPTTSPGPEATPALVPVGQPAQVGAWEVTVTRPAELDGATEVLEFDRDNPVPGPADRYVLVDLRVRYLGPDADGAILDVDLVAHAAGWDVRTSDRWCGRIANELDTLADVEPGASETGRVCFVVADVAVPELYLRADPWAGGTPVAFALR